MAKFTVSSRDEGRIKEYMSKGPQASAHAALSIREQFLTKALVGKILPGVGLVNPLMGFIPTVRVQPLIESEPAVSLNRVEGTSAPEEEPVVMARPFQRETFEEGGLVRKPVIGQTQDTAAVKALPSARVTAPVGQERFSGLHVARTTQRLNVVRGTPAVEAKPTGAKVPQLEEKFGHLFKTRRTVLSQTVDVPSEKSSKTSRGGELPTEGFSVQPQVTHIGSHPKFDAQKLNVGDFSIAEQEERFKRIRTTTALNPATEQRTALDNVGVSAAPEDPLRAVVLGTASQGLEKVFPIKRRHPADALRSVKRFKLLGRTEEFLQQHRFLVFDFTEDGKSVFEWEDGKEALTLAAGFAYCDSPSMEIATESIKEGTWEFEREIPTGVNPGRITLQKGIVHTDTGFFIWLQQFLRGNLTRRKLRILSYGRQSYVAWTYADLGGYGKLPYGQWTLFNCAPVRYQAGQGWDARSGEIQLAELEVAYEWFEEEVPASLEEIFR